MLTIKPYQNINSNTMFGCKSNKKNIKELSETSQKLIESALKVITGEDLKTKNTLFNRLENDIFCSKRFIDGSFMEIKSNPQSKKEGLRIRLLQINKKPVEMNVDSNGDIESSQIKKLNLNSIFEKYLPDILARV